MMRLNLPIGEELSSCRSLLISGMGGGFDVFCGLPLYFELRSRGQTVHLANLSFSPLGGSRQGIRLTKTLVGVNAAYRGPTLYFPELHLARWFAETRGEEITIWCFETTGVRPLLESYRALTTHLALDGILLMDGGVDSLARGDEAQVGTLTEDSTSLAAVSVLAEVSKRWLACLGFGAEMELSHAQVLENVAALAQAEKFLGACALVRQMEAYQEYERALAYVHEKQAQAPSVINASIVAAVEGQFGSRHLSRNADSRLSWISPLTALYWFFDLEAVAAQNRLLPQLLSTNTFNEAMRIVFDLRQMLPIRKPSAIPLT